MNSLIDVLITEYRAEDHSTRVVERIAQANEHLGHTFNRLLALIAAFNVAQKTLDFVGNAQKAASEYQSLEARLTALVGTVENARRKLNMAELVAAPSPFTTKQLANAAVTLEAFGLNSEKLLPILGKLGAAMGATDEKLEVFTRGFGKLGQGEMIDSDVLSAMGITKGDFAAQGIKFDGQGKLQSSAEESLTALQAIVEERFGHILEQMASTPEAKRASLEDAGQKLMRSIGDGFLKANAPFMEALTNLFTGLGNSKVIDEVMGKLSSAFTGLFGGDMSDALAHMSAKILAFLYMIPETIAVIRNNVGEVWHYLSSLFTNLSEKAMYTFSLMVDGVSMVLKTLDLMFNSVFNAQIQGISNLLKLAGVSAQALEAITSHMGVGMMLGAMRNTVKSELQSTFETYRMGLDMIDGFNPVSSPQFQGMPDYAGKEAEIYGKIKAGMAQKGAGIPDTSGMSFFSREPVGEGEDKLGAIAKNTERTAKNTEKFDVGKLLFGGGDRAALGISMADIGLRSGGRAGGRTGFGSYGLGSTPQTRIEIGKPTTNAEAFVAEVLALALPGVLQSLGMEMAK